MKKIFIIGTLAVVVLATFGVAGLASAQTPPTNTPTNPQTPYGGGRMGRGGMWGGQAGIGQPGLMHDYVEPLLAKALGMSEADLEAALAQGQTMWQIAQSKGLTVEEFQKIMLDARQQALTAMVADGVITQAQADWMLSRSQGMWGQGQYGGFGGCPGMGAGMGGFGGGRGRWANPGTSPSTNPNSTSF